MPGAGEPGRSPRGWRGRGSARRRCGAGRPGRCSGRNPLPQLTAPPRGPLGPDWRTTKPGRSFASLPIPYVTHDPMLGRPNCCEPVLANSFAGAWLIGSVTTARRNARSSTTSAVCGRHSETQDPVSPCWANFRFVARSLGGSLEKRVHEGEPLAGDERLGDRLAVIFLELRLVVEQLELAGAAGHEQVDDALRLRREVAGPARQRVGIGGRSARPSPISEARAIEPMPSPQRSKKWRRVRSSRGSGKGMAQDLFDQGWYSALAHSRGDELVQVQEDPGHRRPGVGLGIGCSWRRRAGRSVSASQSPTVALPASGGRHESVDPGRRPGLRGAPERPGASANSK